MHLFVTYAHVNLCHFFLSSSWCQGLAATSACGSSWTFCLLFYISGPLGLWCSTLSFERRVALNPGLGGVRDDASAIISHEQTQKKTKKNESAVFIFGCCITSLLFSFLDAVFPKDLFSDYLGSVLAHLF